jgi:hypothetical protein
MTIADRTSDVTHAPLPRRAKNVWATSALRANILSSARS